MAFYTILLSFHHGGEPRELHGRRTEVIFTKITGGTFLFKQLLTVLLMSRGHGFQGLISAHVLELAVLNQLHLIGVVMSAAVFHWLLGSIDTG